MTEFVSSAPHVLSAAPAVAHAENSDTDSEHSEQTGDHTRSCDDDHQVGGRQRSFIVDRQLLTRRLLSVRC